MNLGDNALFTSDTVHVEAAVSRVSPAIRKLSTRRGVMDFFPMKALNGVTGLHFGVADFKQCEFRKAPAYPSPDPAVSARFPRQIGSFVPAGWL
jgi:hypothetical protein